MTIDTNIFRKKARQALILRNPWGNVPPALSVMLGVLCFFSGLKARAWNITDLATGTNYISSPGTYTNQVYFSSYLVTNDTATAYSNLWVKMGPFTNGAGIPNIALQRGAPNKQNLGLLNASSARTIFFCLNGTNSASSATNAVSLYSGDPDNGGTLLTNILFTLNYVVIVTQSANGSSAGTNYLSTLQPVLGGFLVITSTFTAGSASSKPGLYASYPAISNGWDATTFTLVSNSFSILSVDTANDFTNFQNQIVGYVPWSKASTMTNVAVFRVVNTKPTSTPISSGAFVNTGNGAIPNYVLPSDAGILNPIPPATNRLVLTNWASATRVYTNTTVYFTNSFSNAASLGVQADDLICTLPPGFVYAGSATFAGVAINAPVVSNSVVVFSQGYTVPANGSASLVFAAVPTNAVNAAGNVTNRTVFGTYSAYGLIGTNHIDLTYDTTDNTTPTNQVQVLLNPTAVNDSTNAVIGTALNVPAPGVLANDVEPNFLAFGVASNATPASGSVTVTNNGGYSYLDTNAAASDSFVYYLTNTDGRVASATVSLAISKATPVFSGLTSPSITYGSTSIVLSGSVSAPGTVTLYPTNGATVTATINGHLVSGTVTNNTGGFWINYNDASLATDGVGSSPYTISYSCNGDGRLNTAANTGTSLTVSKATPTATLAVTNSPVTFDGNPHAAAVGITASSVPGSVANIVTGGAASQTPAGTYAATADFVPADSADYNSLTGLSAGNFVINKATPTATLAVTNSPVTFDGNPHAAAVGISSSSVPGSVANILTGGAASKTTAGTYAVTADFAPTDSTDYNSLTGLPTGNFIISKATPILSVTNSPVTYNGSPRAASVSGSVSGTASNVKYNGSATVPTSAGTYAITADFAPTDSTDYTNLTGAAAGNFVINQATPVLTLTSSANPAGYRDSLTFTASLPADATGSVTFATNGVAFSTNVLSGGSATSSAAGGLPRAVTNVVTASYGGDGNYLTATNGITQTVTNHPPTAVNDSASTPENIAVAIPVLTNDSDQDGDALTVVSVNPTNGTAGINGTNIVFTPATNFVGTAWVGYTVSDGFGGTGTAIVTVNVTLVNQPPTLNPIGNVNLVENWNLQTVNLSGLTPGPTNDSGQTLTITAVSDNPSLVPNPAVNYTNPATTGTLTFTPATNSFGSATVTVVVRDNGGTANGGIDSLTNTFTVTLTGLTNYWYGGSNLTVNIFDANGGPGAGYSQTNYLGVLSVPATGTNPFTINLASFNGGSPGPAANFNNASNYTWTIATTTRGVIGLTTNQFIVNNGAFTNDLAGGTFTVVLAPDGYSVNLVFNPNHPPVANPVSLERALNTSLKISISNLLANYTTDPDGDARRLACVGVSTNGSYLSTNSLFILFAPTNNISESFIYVVRDGRTYRPGDTVPTATNWITVNVIHALGYAQSISIGGGAPQVIFAGVPGYGYDVQRATNISGPWTIIYTTNAPANGRWIYTDNNPPPGMAFYRTSQH